MTHEQIYGIPKDHTVTYTIIVVYYREQKADPNCVQITAGGKFIEYPYELTTRKYNLIITGIVY